VTEVELEQSGHSPHLECPDEFRTALLTLIDTNDARP
jgi:pimeloyl-ACP methyl ester carboxylesterase